MTIFFIVSSNFRDWSCSFLFFPKSHCLGHFHRSIYENCSYLLRNRNFYLIFRKSLIFFYYISYFLLFLSNSKDLVDAYLSNELNGSIAGEINCMVNPFQPNPWVKYLNMNMFQLDTLVKGSKWINYIVFESICASILVESVDQDESKCEFMILYMYILGQDAVN